MITRLLQAVVLSACFMSAGAHGDTMASSDGAQRLLQMLDYVGVDYPATVSEGRVIDTVEYAEMLEFSTEILRLLSSMPPAPNKAELQQVGERIRLSVEKGESGARVAEFTTQLKLALIASYDIVVAPAHFPDMEDVRSLYESNCANCHGMLGYGDGPIAKTLSPAPSNFHDSARQHSRSVYDLYNTISLGVPETPMNSFSHLSDDQRWALALMVSRFSGSAVQRQNGELLWHQGHMHDKFSSMADITSMSYARAGELALQAGLSAKDGEAVLTYLRDTPEIMQVSDHVALDTSIAKLGESVDFARAGDSVAAHKAALAAYLDGFELAEPSVVVLDKALKLDIEKVMIEFRELARSGDVDALELKQAEAVALLIDAKRLLGESSMSGEAAFAGAFIILLREGVEAILVLAAIMAALIKTGRNDAMKYIHIGWISAVLLGIVTWWVADNIISISGASREVTEGVAALIAALILVYVGFWLHNASHSKRWKQFVEHKVTSAMEGSTLWVLALVSFLAVYREMFETVLFYQAMWVQVEIDSQHSFFMGIFAAIALLLMLSLLVYRVGVKLPIRQFFQVNAVLLFLLAVVFAGQGIAALQEAGMVSASLLNFPRIEMLGVYPTLQSLGLQCLVLMTGIGLMMYQRKSG